MVVILNCNSGNLFSIKNAVQKLNYPCKVSSDYHDIKNAELLILPGQGSFEKIMTFLNESGLAELVINHINEKKPFIGICVGFQILFQSSEESSIAGLGLLNGALQKFKTDTLKVPHMGWNQLNINPMSTFEDAPLFNNKSVYFVHSYFLPTTNTDIVCSTTHYNDEFVSMIHHDNLLATQFHPEKSGSVGLGILDKFIGKYINQ